MAKPFSALPGILDKRRKEINDGINRVARGAAEEAGRVAVRTTRVDTGEARSNWRASKNSPLSGTIPPYAPGVRRGINERANSLAARAQHKTVLATWRADKNKKFFITNNVKHAARLNSGHPAGFADNMLGKAVLAWRKFLSKRRITKLLKG